MKLSETFLKLNDYEKAKKYANFILRNHDEKDVKALYILGECHFQMNELRSARKYANEAYEITENSKEVMDLVVRIENTLDENEVTLQSYDKFIVSNKSHFKAFFERGKYTYHRQMYDLALEDLYKAKKIHPRNKEVQELIASVEEAKQNAQKESSDEEFDLEGFDDSEEYDSESESESEPENQAQKGESSVLLKLKKIFPKMTNARLQAEWTKFQSAENVEKLSVGEAIKEFSTRNAKKYDEVVLFKGMVKKVFDKFPKKCVQEIYQMVNDVKKSQQNWISKTDVITEKVIKTFEWLDEENSKYEVEASEKKENEEILRQALPEIKKRCNSDDSKILEEAGKILKFLRRLIRGEPTIDRHRNLTIRYTCDNIMDPYFGYD